jgi:hypothetical protein
MSIDTIIGIVGGAILGFITTYIFHIVEKRRKELCWSIDNANLIKGYSSLFEDLEIRYKGKEIENLTVSKIVFWNNGNETIDHTDIAIPLGIFPLENTEILDVKILNASSIGNHIRTQSVDNENITRLLFDYLDSQQGAVLQVIHTGISALNVMIYGEIKGIKQIIYKTKRRDIFSRVARIGLYFYAVCTLLLVGTDLYFSVVQKTKSISPLWLTVLTGILICGAMVYDIREARNTARIPKEFSVFEEASERLNKK